MIKEVFVAYDFEIKGGLIDMIDDVAKHAPDGHTLSWPGSPEGPSQAKLA